MPKQFKTESTRLVFSRDNRNFDDFNKLMKDTALQIFEGGVTKEQANKKIKQIFREVLGLTDKSSKREIKKAIRRNKTEIFEVIEELVPNLLHTGWGENPFFRDFVEFKSLDLGDTNEFYVEDDILLTVSELSGNHHDIIRQRLGEGQTFSVKTSWYGVKIYTEFEHFMTGQVDWAKFIQKIYEAFDRKVNAMLYESFMEAPEKVLPANEWIKNLPLDDANAATTNRNTINDVVGRLSSLNGCEMAFVGTRVALSKLDTITPSEYISDGMKEERHTTGRIGLWEGIKKIEIPVVFEPGSVTTTIGDNDKIFIMPLSDNKFIKMFDEGDAQVKEVNDGNTHMDKTFEYEYQQKMGVATVINMKFGLINITKN